MVTTELALLGLAGKFLAKPATDLYETATGAVKNFAKAWITSGAIDKLEQRIEDLEKIRTIVSRQASTLSEIYYPARIKEKSQVLTFTSLSDFNDKNLLITGTAGQGKSVFMRYLAIQELRQGKKVPIFIELRRIDATTSLKDQMEQQLDFQSAEQKQELLGPLLSRGNVVVFLDGFDELSREYSLTVKTEIQSLIAKYSKVKFVISSRPGALCAHIQDLPRLRHLTIDELNENDFDPFFLKIGTDDAVRIKLKTAIDNSSVAVKKLLKTPLMLTLLVLTCGNKQNIPDTLPEFYDSLFRVLSLMHDETKPGYVRQMATTLTYSDLEKLFECFSFISREKYERPSLNVSQFDECVRGAIEYTELSCTSEGFKTDVTDTVCLMVREGVDTTFIHKSIQEYYTARFIKSLPDDESAKRAYSSFTGVRTLVWTAELKFLEQIDPYRYQTFFRKIQAQNFLDAVGYKEGRKILTTKAALRKVLKYYLILGDRHASMLTYSAPGVEQLNSQLFYEMAPAIKSAAARFSTKQSPSTSISSLLVSHPGLLPELEKHFQTQAKNALIELDRIKQLEDKQRANILDLLKLGRRKP
jgi:Cdc6-like AAA superfamily ATPase